MAYVIAEACIGVKDRTCVDVCPVNCIYDAGDQYLIDPRDCIDCRLCVRVCPVDAIFAEHEVPSGQEAYIAKNADFFRPRG